MSCEADGRSGITYQWYKLSSGFGVPPSDSDKLPGQNGTEFEFEETDYPSGSMFQCVATSGDELILSDVATVTFNKPASGEF